MNLEPFVQLISFSGWLLLDKGSFLRHPAMAPLQMKSGTSSLPLSGLHPLSCLLSPSPSPRGSPWALLAGCSCPAVLGRPPNPRATRCASPVPSCDPSAWRPHIWKRHSTGRSSLTQPGHGSCSEPFSSQLWVCPWHGTHLLQTHLISDHHFHPVPSDKKGTGRQK